MSKPKLTPWFPSDTKPARVGVYNATDQRVAGVYRYWDEKQWYFYSLTINGAHRNFMAVLKSCHSNFPWRGLASDPALPDYIYRAPIGVVILWGEV